MIHTMAQSADWFRATTLTERIALYRAGTDNEVGPREISERAQKRMERWRSVSPFNKGDLFKQRLGVDGLTEEMLLLILNEPEEALGGPHHLDNEGAKIREATATSGKVSVPDGNTTFWRCKDLLCCPSSNTSPGVW